MKYQPIENYGIIGNLNTVALVGMNGSIDFMCFPAFDSPSIFLRLLDHELGGYFRIAPVLSDVRQKQLYLPDTNVLLTRFLSEEGVAELSDFMPVDEKRSEDCLIRRAKTVRGEIHYRMTCKPAFDYARKTHRIEEREGEVFFMADGERGFALRLSSDVPLKVEGGAAVAEFTLGTGETAAFVLEEAKPGKASIAKAPKFVAEAFKNTVNFWQEWSGKTEYRGRWREIVNRSALTLKLLTSREYGSIVAAPTFGLPEEIGGERNWDYRYAWIRDASFTLYALIRLGYTEEATAFMKWISGQCMDMRSGELKIMYSLSGDHVPGEEELKHLEGYRQSSPVRIGNQAAKQLQLDIYGELMDTVYLYNKYGEPISKDLWDNLTPMLKWLCENWNQPDEGIWEVRGGRKHFLFSRLGSWVALDRGIRLAKRRSFAAPLDQMAAARDAIYKEIHSQFWDKKQKAFVQYKGAKALDASSLLMPLFRFIDPKDPRWLSHLENIEKELVYDSLVKRYDSKDSADDGLFGSEETFSICSFWFVECLGRSGELEKARFYFEKMLGYANHLGLYAEELDLRGEQLGNFPQAFTHLALISAAYDIDRRLAAQSNGKGRKR